ncbi:hypothetical protein AAES_113080 [Amazona aestiva]|uniref:Uncharacterized protein n=1 Tax=Amazona aestiva TaxID=12930 RepID=A0A0Q3M7G8_AMAAE|nr:hypothetical protein AAES_113080 [Amazona aestiva]
MWGGSSAVLSSIQQPWCGGAEVHCADPVLLQELDCKLKPISMLELVAKDGSTATIHISILDTIDSSAAFSQSSVMMELPEDALPSSLLLDLCIANTKKGPVTRLLCAQMTDSSLLQLLYL